MRIGTAGFLDEFVRAAWRQYPTALAVRTAKPPAFAFNCLIGYFRSPDGLHGGYKFRDIDFNQRANAGAAFDL